MVFTRIALLHFCSSHFWQVREMETMDLNWEPVTTVPSYPSHLQKKSCINYTWCNTSYVFVECQSTRRVEREDIEVDKLAFKHDWTNLFYCYTLYEFNPFFCISTGLWLSNNISSFDFLSQQCIGIKSNRYLIYYEKTTHYESDL